MQIIQFFSDSKGKLSSMRLAFLVYTFGVILTWIFVSFSKKELQPIDNSVILGMGLLAGGKALQAVNENNISKKSKIS